MGEVSLKPNRCYVVINLGVDLVYPFVDPRILLGHKEVKVKRSSVAPVEPKPAPPPLLDVLALELPKDRPAGRMLGEGVGAVAALVTALQNEAKVL